MEYYDKNPSRRPAHPHAVSSFTRGERKDTNMHPEGHVHMDEKYHQDTRAYNAYKRKTKKGKTGGRRRHGSRHTRRRRHGSRHTRRR